MNPIFRIMTDKDVVTMGLISGLFNNLRLDWGHFRTISLAVKLMKSSNSKPWIRVEIISICLD